MRSLKMKSTKTCQAETGSYNKVLGEWLQGSTQCSEVNQLPYETIYNLKIVGIRT